MDRQHSRVRKGVFSLLLAALLLICSMPFASAVGNPTVLDLADGPIVIDHAGDYVITGTYTGTDPYVVPITVNAAANITLDNIDIHTIPYFWSAIVVNDVANITLDNVYIKGAMNLPDGGSIEVVGDNELNGSIDCYNGEAHKNLLLYGSGTLSIDADDSSNNAIGSPTPFVVDWEFNLEIADCTLNVSRGIIVASTIGIYDATLDVDTLCTRGYTVIGDMYIYNSQVEANDLYTNFYRDSTLYCYNSCVNGVVYP